MTSWLFVRVYVPLKLVGVAALPWLVAWPDLPDRVATHWGFDGTANGSMSRVVAMAVLVGLTVLFAAALVQGTGRAAPVAGFAGTVVAMASVATVVTNHGVATWHDAELRWWWIPIMFATGALTTVVLARFTPAEVHATLSPPTADPPAVVPSPGERLAWTGHGEARWNRYTAALLAVVGGLLLLVSATGGGIALLLTALVLVEFESVRVTVGQQGVRVSAPIGLPWITIPLKKIEHATAIDVRPMDWGGWGYRGSLRWARKSAWVLRQGPGLRLDLRDGGTFVVTVDKAREAAAVVNGLVATSTPR